MIMKLEKIDYKKLNSKQKEIYNFQIVAGELAEYGFNCIKLADDWNGADFLAYHFAGNKTLKVQLKSRLTVAQKYLGNEIYMAFSVSKTGRWYLILHEKLVQIMRENVGILGQDICWDGKGEYSTQSPNAKVLQCIEPYML